MFFDSLENINIVQRLIRNQDLNTGNRYGETPLNTAAEKGIKIPEEKIQISCDGNIEIIVNMIIILR